MTTRWGAPPPVHVNCRCPVVSTPVDVRPEVDAELIAEMRPPCEWRDIANRPDPCCTAAAAWIVHGRCQACRRPDVSLLCQQHFEDVTAGTAWLHCVHCGHTTRQPLGMRAERL